MLFDAGNGRSQKRYGQKNYLRQFRPETPLEYLRKMIKEFANWEFAF